MKFRNKIYPAFLFPFSIQVSLSKYLAKFRRTKADNFGSLNESTAFLSISSV